MDIFTFTNKKQQITTITMRSIAIADYYIADVQDKICGCIILSSFRLMIMLLLLPADDDDDDDDDDADQGPKYRVL